MDESNEFVHVSEKQKIKALKLVVSADDYLAQRQLLQALNLYKESAEILPDPAIIRKIKKLRKYMKRNGMDLGEDKENQVDNINNGKEVSPDAMTMPNSANKSLRERINFAKCSDSSPKDSPKPAEIITDKVSNFKPENASIKMQEDLDVIVTENKPCEIVSDCPPVTVPENVDDDKKETQHKRDIRHQKPGLSSLKPEVPLNNAKDRPSKMSPPATLNTLSEKFSPKREDPIRSFKDLRRRMYPHQKEGMKWLARLFGEQKGGILGDDMGLGKTLQVIGYLYKMFEVNEIEHVLIVLPSALILPWQSEITRWAPNLNYAIFHGKSRASRLKLLHNLQRQGGILLTTYGLIVTNYEELSKGTDGREFIWDYVFLDEGHKIKNPTKTQKAAHYIPAYNRIIITGTPIQNNLVELWSLFDFVHHGSLLGTLKTFKMNYENTITRARQKDASLIEKQLGYTMSLNLQKIIAPYFLRRTKAELMADPNSGLPTLPRKNDIIVWVKMTADQKKVYESYLRLDEVKELMSSSRSPLVALNILKKICDHLRLLSMRICKALGMLTTEEARKYVGDRISHLDDPLEIPEWTRQPGAEEPAISTPAKQSKETACAATQLTSIPDSILYKESSKLMVVIELLGYLCATGHKCLVFSQSTKMLDIIQHILINLPHRHVRMDGQIIKLDERAEIIRQFETNKDIHTFLLTTQVGGVGLNLTVADRIIIVDPNWNPAIDSQTVDRIYRIGQKKNVIIFRLITCGSVEEKIYIRQIFKLSINKQITKESEDPFRYFTKQDLKQLFIVDDLSVSKTQLKLTEMHASKRVSDEVVDDQIKFLESMEAVFGVSDHDLVFSTEDADQEVKMSNSTLQAMVEKAEEAIGNEINEESRANTKKVVPGIQERRPPSVETWTSQPIRLSSPLLNLSDEEENRDEGSRQREVRHRRSNAGSNSVSVPSEEVILSDQETTSPYPNNKDNDVITLSDVQSEGNDNSEVILDSEEEHPPPLAHHTFPALDRHGNEKATGDIEPLPTKTTPQDINTSSNSIDNNAALPTMLQEKIINFVNSQIKWDKTNPRKRQADRNLVEMICKDLQTVSIVEEEGFKSFVKCLQPAYQLPTSQHISSVLIPDLYESVSIDIQQQLSNIKSISLTLDYWTSRANDSYMSVIAHFLTPSFDIKDFCLNVSHSPHSHTAENISKEICSTIRKWFPDGNADKINIYLVSDNAANMVAASNLLPCNYQLLQCFAHKLQLVVKDSIKAFPDGQKLISKCRKIVSHFQHSALSTNKLKEMQTSMGLMPPKLKTECETRWNSTYYMIERLVNQKEPLAAVLASLDKVEKLTQTDWKLATEYVDALKPFEDATKIMLASRYSTASMIIPILNILIDKMRNSELDCFGELVIANIKSRWPNYESEELYAITTCLDPRFKLIAFSDESMKTMAKSILMNKLLVHQSLLSTLSSDAGEGTKTKCVQHDQSNEQKEERKDFWGFLRKKVKDEKKETDTKDKREYMIKSEVHRYLDEKNIDPSACPFVWWKKNGMLYPNLSLLARDFLSIPATSVASERIFSKEELVISDRRCRLKPTHAEKLFFLNHNLRQ